MDTILNDKVGKLVQNVLFVLANFPQTFSVLLSQIKLK